VSAEREVVARVLVGGEGAAFRAFAGRVPMSAATPLAVERHGAAPFDHFVGSSVEVGVTVDGRPAAYAHAVLGRFRVSAGPVATAGYERDIAYVGDIRVDPDVQRRRLGTRLLDTLAEALVARGVLTGFCFVNEGNDAILGLFASGRSRMVGARSGSFRTGSRLLLARPRAASVAGRRFVPVPLESLAAARAYAARLAEAPFALRVEAPALAEIARSAGEDLVVLARAEAPDEPVFAVWNQRARRKLRVLALPPALAAVATLWRLAARVTGGPPPPRAGDAWSATELCWIDPAMETEPARDAMISKALEVAWGLGSHFLNVPFELGQRAPAGPLWQWTTSHLVTLRFDGGLPSAFGGANFAHDLSRI
jgi:ribosomal protein S18 acetylase RimI-like enzyme